MTRGDIINIISALIESAENVPITSNFQVVSRDPDDNIIINTVHDGNADYIVSGDRAQFVENFMIEYKQLLEDLGKEKKDF